MDKTKFLPDTGNYDSANMFIYHTNILRLFNESNISFYIERYE